VGAWVVETTFFEGDINLPVFTNYDRSERLSFVLYCSIYQTGSEKILSQSTRLFAEKIPEKCDRYDQKLPALFRKNYRGHA
jgi:hypothetical protein